MNNEGSKIDVNLGSEQNVVYIDPNTDASGDGSYSSPYKYWSQVTFQAGYTYKQKRGTIAREEIEVDVSGTSDNPISIGAYGSGDQPIIQGSEIETGWTLHSGNIYNKVIDLGSDGALGMVAENGSPLSFLTWNTDATTTFTGATAGTFAYDYNTKTVYVWSSDGSSPDNFTMEVSQRKFGIHAVDQAYIEVDNVHVRYVSLHGMAFESTDNVTVSNSVIEKVGGAVIAPASMIYAGNGIEFGNDSNNGTVRSTTLNDIFDSGVTPQTYDSDMTASGFEFSDLTISKCGFAGVEIAVLYNNGNTNSSISNVTIENVNISDNGTGWSGRRYDNEGRGIKIAADISSDGITTAGNISDVVIKQATIFNSKGEGIFLGGNAGTVTIQRSKIYDNNLDGILAQEASSSTLNLVVMSSIISGNGANDSSNDHQGISYNAPSGSGLQLYHNTFYDNANIGLAIWNVNGTVAIANNLFHRSSTGTHLYVADTLDNNAIENNFFTDFLPDVIIGNVDSSTYTTGAGLNAAAYAQNNFGSDTPDLNSSLQLQSSASACYQAGITTTGITVDYSGVSYLSPPTVGAYEYH